jgi:competence protein ComEC
MKKIEIIIILILVSISLLRFVFQDKDDSGFDKVVGEEITFEGMIIEDPDIRINNQHLKMKINGYKNNILVMTSRDKEYSYGDSVRVFGMLEKPENFVTDNGREFNYKRYLANQKVYYLVKRAEVEIISTGGGNQIKSFLFNLKRNFIKNVNKVLASPESDLANGLVLGVRGGFDEDLKGELIDTGTIHIVALSGYNVSIIAEAVIKFFGLILPASISIVLSIVIIILFVLMTGASATIVRAGVMAIIMLFGRLTGRTYLAGRALVITGLVMIVFSPTIITDMSFQLSFIATAGVLFVTPKVIKIFKFIPLRFGLREIISSTVSASISVLPLLLYLTGVFSLVSIPTNIIIALAIPYAMFLVFLTGIFPPLSIFFGYLASLILSFILFIIHFFGSLSFSSFTIYLFPLWLTILIYLFLIWWVFVKNEKS